MDTVSGGAMTNPEEDLAEGSVAVRVLVQVPAVTGAADIRNKLRLVFGLSVSIVKRRRFTYLYRLFFVLGYFL